MTTESNTMMKARRRLVLDNRFWGMLSLRLNILEDPSVETACTNGREIRYNPEWFDALDPREQEALVAHEVNHCALGHPFRLGGRDPELANVAMDHAINLDLLQGKFKLPVPHLADPRFRGMAFEKVYAVLAAEKEAEAQKGSPAPGNGPKRTGGDSGQDTAPGGSQTGSGDPSQGKPTPGKSEPSTDPAAGSNEAPGTGSQDPATTPKPGNWGKVEAPPVDATVDPIDGSEVPSMTELANEWAKAVETAVLVAAKAGDLPGSVRTMIDEAIQTVEDLGSVLQPYLLTKGGASYAAPNKRMLHRGICMPGKVRSALEEIVVAVDTSGSINHALLRYFRDTINEILLMEEAPERITIIYCDTAVRYTEEILDGQIRNFNPVGGGGTKFNPVFDHIELLGMRPDVLIYLTDLENSHSEKLTEPDYPTLWVAPIQSNRQQAFGELVRVDPYQSR